MPESIPPAFGSEGEKATVLQRISAARVQFVNETDVLLENHLIVERFGPDTEFALGGNAYRITRMLVGAFFR